MCVDSPDNMHHLVSIWPCHQQGGNQVKNISIVQTFLYARAYNIKSINYVRG